MSVHEKTNLLKEVWCDDSVTGIIIGEDRVMSVNRDSEWRVDRIFTDYKIGDEHEELIVVFKRKGKTE